MKRPADAEDFLISKAGEDSDFRQRLLARPKETIEAALGVTLAEGHTIHVHEETPASVHLVLPPRDRFSTSERQAAKTGATSLAFLRQTMHDPAPPARPPVPARPRAKGGAAPPESISEAARESIRRGLGFLESSVDENGAWHCIRFNLANPDIPRHFERPPFVSALCALALQSCKDARARAICAATRNYLTSTIEYPGLWRYYRHLPQDLDSTALCSLAIGGHPWLVMGRNIPKILANRDREGRFMTWVLAEDEPDMVSSFRIEADPVVNANVIACLGDRPEITDAGQWLTSMIAEDRLDGASKWYPDAVSTYYAAARAMLRARPALDQLRPILAERILGLRDGAGAFGNILQTAQAISALYNTGSLRHIDRGQAAERFISQQREDGSWPELLAFGDQALKWGMIGQIGHGSESVTTAFCIEALERLSEAPGA